MRRQASLLLGALCVLVLMFGVTAASAAPSRTWINDFERVGDDQPTPGDWNPFVASTIQREPSGYVSSGYASGIPSAHGRWHARLRTGGCEAVRQTTDCYGPYTYWGKYQGSNPTFPDGGYVTDLDVYLDVQWAASHDDYRVDWSSAINDSTGNFKRDWVFNISTQLPTDTNKGFLINASTNALRSGANPHVPCPNPAAPSPNYCRVAVWITTSGWYTFRHRFRSINIGGADYLAVDFSILRNNAPVPGASWTIYGYPFDPMATVGGDSYGWFANQEINDLAIDCSAIHPPGMVHPALYAPCRFARAHEGEPCDSNGDSNQAERDELDRINRERSAALLPPLTLNATSSDVARKHACDERAHGDVGERGSDGSKSSDRLQAAGVPFLFNAENNGFALGSTVSEALGTIQSDFLGDSTSQANELNPAFTQVGIGAVYLGGEMYLTEDFTG